MKKIFATHNTRCSNPTNYTKTIGENHPYDMIGKFTDFFSNIKYFYNYF